MSEDNTCQDFCLTPSSLQNIFDAVNISQRVILLIQIPLALNQISPSSLISYSASCRMIQYIKYMNVTYSNDIMNMLTTMTSNTLSLYIGIPVPDILKDINQYHPVAGSFQRYKESSSFLVNVWDDFVLLVIMGTVSILLKGIEIFSQSYPHILKKYQLITKVRQYSQCLFLLWFYGRIGSLLFYLLMGFKYIIPHTSMATYNVLASFILLLPGFVILITHNLIVYQFHKLKKGSLQESLGDLEVRLAKLKEENEGYRVLYDDFQSACFVKQNFLFFTTCRFLIVSIFLAIFYDNPLVEAIINLICGIVVIICIIIWRPFTKISNTVEQLCNELILLIVNSSVLITVSSDYQGKQDLMSIINLGNVIIYSNLVLTYLPCVFISTNFVLLIKRRYDESKKKNVIIEAKVDEVRMDTKLQIPKEEIRDLSTSVKIENNFIDNTYNKEPKIKNSLKARKSNPKKRIEKFDTLPSQDITNNTLKLDLSISEPQERSILDLSSQDPITLKTIQKPHRYSKETKKSGSKNRACATKISISNHITKFEGEFVSKIMPEEIPDLEIDQIKTIE